MFSFSFSHFTDFTYILVTSLLLLILLLKQIKTKNRLCSDSLWRSTLSYAIVGYWSQALILVR